LGWAVDNMKLPSNPAAGMTLKVSKPHLTRAKEFSDAEAVAILRAASSVERGRDKEKSWLAKRWVPWLMAYTGARVGEMMQLRREDISDAGDHWVITITPEAGTVKTGRYREVPLHPHLVDLGFPEVIRKAPPGHLFVYPNSKTGDVLGALKGATNHLAEFVRETVDDRRVSPNHAWRHRFITQCRKHGVSEELRGMITGHAGKDVAAREYGGPAGLYREICKLPRISLEDINSGSGADPSPHSSSEGEGR
jgi:integrase